MEERLPRKLAAILYADVAGYSRLTGEDEDTTHRRLRDYLDLIAESIQSHHGQVMHYAGDAVSTGSPQESRADELVGENEALNKNLVTRSILYIHPASRLSVTDRIASTGKRREGGNERRANEFRRGPGL